MSTITRVPDVMVVVRGVGERTEAIVARIAEQEVGADHVVIVTGAPFSQTLRRSFEVGIERNLPWTCCLDADELLFPDALLNFRRAVQVAPRNLFGIQGVVLDKLFGGMRAAGVRIYQTKLLEQAISFIPDDLESKRPETHVRRIMQRSGFEYITQGILSGLHDFEQYYRDVYRTAFFHAQKHKRFMPILHSYWERNSTSDPDFLVALRGVEDGLQEERVLGLNVRNFIGKAEVVLSDLGLQEKQPLTLSKDEAHSFADKTVAEWQTPPEYDEFLQHTREPSRVARLLGPSMLHRLGLSGTPEQ